MIGHALEYVNPYELKSYMAIIYGLIEAKDVTNCYNHIVAERFEQCWIRLGKTYTTSLPGLKAPVSCVMFWCRRLGFDSNKYAASEDIGYFSIEEFKAEIRGHYQFYMDRTR